MAALVIDSSSNTQPNLAAKQTQIRPCDQFHATSGSLSSRISLANSDDHLDNFASSSHKPIVSLSSVIMSSEKPTNSTNGYATQPASTSQSNDSFGHYLSETSKAKISSILVDVEKLNDIEKLYLYLQLPDGTCNNESANNDKKKVLYNPFGKKTDTEVIQTYTWIQSHLEEDISVSIPKHEVYEDYRVYCEANKFDKLCVADFGKAMKHIFPHVKPRRLGQRGNSKYCYSGLRKKILVESPELPVLDTSEYKFGNEERDSKKNVLADDVAWNVILDWVEKTFSRKFKSSIDFARHLIETENIDLSKALKNGDNKVHSQMVKNYISKASTAKKKDVFSQINKKLHDKKKCDIERTHSEKSFPPTNSVRAKTTNNFVSPKTINYAKVDGFDNLNIASVSPLKLTVKTEPEETAYSTANSKGQISNASFTNSSPSIILFPESQATPNQTLSDNGSTLNKSSTSELNHTVSVAANSSTIKYKPIQPKPINLESMAQCFPEADNGHFNSLNNANIDKRRHSVSTPFNMDALNHKELECFSFGSELKLVENDKNYKRQMDEKDFQFMTKKRHVSMPEGSKVTCNSSIENSDLKVNELETEALYDYLNTNTTPSVFDSINSNDNSSLSNSTNSTMNDCNKESFVQIRKLLENHLGGNIGNINQETLPKHNLDNDPMMPNLFADCAKSNSHCSMPKSNYQFTDNSNGFAKEMVPTTLDGVGLGNCPLGNNLNNNNQVQIPPSPNARRRAFSFQPISPRNTPTIPENSALDMNMFNKSANNSYNGFGTSQMKQMSTVAVGPSQPSSENNSPFISPRNTPIPMSSVSRSRNNSGQSGQSNYSNYRQTSLPNFDSGVSSISNSPFISPQATPIPGAVRIRALDNSNRNLARVRHSSGPGGPINRSQIANVMIYNRSNSLSPMISGENNFVFSNQNFNSNQNMTSIVGNNGNSKFNEDLMNRLNVVSQENKLAMEFASSQLQFNPTGDNGFQAKAMNTRQRHFSTPYGGAANTTALMKADENDTFKLMLLNRSQSVPLSQMFQSNQFDSLEQQFFAPLCSGTDPGSLSGLDPNLSKSYPTTPLCNDSFKLPHSTSIGTSTSSVVNAGLDQNGYLNSPSIDDLLTNADSIISSGQDVFVSSVHINQGINSGSNDATSSVDDLNVPSPLMLAKSDRDGLNDLGLISDNVVDDNFQSLAEFRDCDNDFSNLELDNQANSYDDVFKFP